MQLFDFDPACGTLQSPAGLGAAGIPDELSAEFAPASAVLYEWTEYLIRCSGAERLRVGDDDVPRFDDGWFRLQFKNQLGLCQLRAYSDGKLLGRPLWVEVLSPKFPDARAHHAFLRTLLDDLFARATRLSFTFTAPTARGVSEASPPPTPLFTLHFMLQSALELRAAWNTVRSSPHRALADHPAVVPIAQASEADADVLLDILHQPDRWTRAGGFPLARQLRGHAPLAVWQRRPEETPDTPENRFVLAFLRDLLAAAERLPAQGWWGKVSTERQGVVAEATALLRLATLDPLFAEVGPMRRFPGASRVLMRREGYREMLVLWQRFQQARRPLFGALQQAIELRDVATLYEIWAFFALVEEIQAALNCRAALKFSTSDTAGLDWEACADFGRLGSLVYNLTGRSYSVRLRPDFTWERDGRAEVALDAKFRFDRRAFDESDMMPEATARQADIYKMHTYRDALQLRAAVVLYPGDQSLFYPASATRRADPHFRDLLGSVCIYRVPWRYECRDAT